MVNLNKYNREKFVNREQPLAIIQEKLKKLSSDSPPAESELINFWGMGGNGKTFLKKQIKKIYDSKNNHPTLSNYIIIDWNGDAFLNKTYSIPEILIYYRNEFARYGFEMKEFTKFITYYRKCTSASLPEIVDENEESVTKSIFKGLFDFLSQSTGLGAAIDGVIDITQTSNRKKKNKKLKEEYEKFSSFDAGTMLAILLEAFIEDINCEINKRKIIFIIDTFEDVRSINLDWIFSRKTEFKHMPGLFYALQPSLWIVFGRDETNLNDRQTSFQLENFNIPETLAYIKENLQTISEDNVNQVFSYSNGYPLLLSELHHEFSSTQTNVTTEFFDQLKDGGKIENILKNRYKKYFSESFNDLQSIYLLKILFAFRQWTIHKEAIIDSDVYQFTKDYHGQTLQTIDLESKLQQLFQRSFINEVSNVKGTRTYEIDKSVYKALIDQTIDDIPVLSNELKRDVIAFLLHKLTMKNRNSLEIGRDHYVFIDESQAEVTQLVDLLCALYKNDDPVLLYEKVMKLLQENQTDESITSFIQVVLLERYSTDYLSTQLGQQLIVHVLTDFQKSGITEYIDRFVYLLNDVDNSQLLNEKLGHYFLSIGRLSYAKRYLGKAIPSLDQFKNAEGFFSANENNPYNNPASLTLDIHPARLIEGFEFETESEDTFEENMYLYRRFLHNTRQFIRTKIELGDTEELVHLVKKWEIALYLDEINEDDNVMHAMWLHIDTLMLEKSEWYPSVIKEFEQVFKLELPQNKNFAIENPAFIMSIFKLSNSLFELGYYQVQEILYDYVTDVLQLAGNPEIQNHYDLSALFEVYKSARYKRSMMQREMLMYPLFVEGAESERTKIKERISSYYETRAAENWELPFELGEMLETGQFDIKVMQFLNRKDEYLPFLDQVINQLELVNKENFYLAELYYEKGIHLLQHDELLESHQNFHKARNIVFTNLGKYVETSKVFIPYESHDLFTRFRLLKNESMPIDKQEFERFKERAELNRTMIMNSYEDDLPSGITYYLMSVETIEGLESIVYEEEYQENIKQVTELLNAATSQQLDHAVEKLGKYLFLDITEKYYREFLFYIEKMPQNPIETQINNIVKNARNAWANYEVPTYMKEVYYETIIEGMKSIVYTYKDFDLFFNEYFKQILDNFKIYHKQSNQLNTEFDQLTQIIVKLQFSSNKHRNKILKTLIHALKFS